MTVPYNQSLHTLVISVNGSTQKTTTVVLMMVRPCSYQIQQLWLTS